MTYASYSATFYYFTPQFYIKSFRNFRFSVQSGNPICYYIELKTNQPNYL